MSDPLEIKNEMAQFDQKNRDFYDSLDDDQKKKLESLWAKDPKLAYLYAVNVLHKRFPAGEDTIATDAAYSYLYAREVLHKRFPAGEDVIARNDSYSYLYAKHVLRDPDPGSWADRYRAKHGL